MSNEKFTKGPWIVNSNGSYFDIGPKNEGSTIPVYPNVCIGVMHYSEPDAHLIAAAPEMYDALALMIRYANMLEEELLSRRIEVTSLYLDSPHEQPPEGVAESALSKARGEQ